MTKLIKFQITTEVDPWIYRKKTDRVKKENILFSYNDKVNVNPLDVKDRSLLFTPISEIIILDWLKVDRATTLGLDYPYIIDGNSQLSAIVDCVLCEKFNDSFIANYDRDEHTFIFKLLVDIDNYQLIEYNVEEVFGQFKYKEFNDDAEFAISFIINVIVHKTIADKIYISYTSIFGNKKTVTDSEPGWFDTSSLYDYFVKILVNQIVNDWYLLEYYKMNDYILGTTPVNEYYSVVEDIITNLIYEKFPKVSFTNKEISSQNKAYLFELKIKNKKLQSLSIQDREPVENESSDIGFKL